MRSLLIAVLSALAAAVPSSAGERPNVVVLLADDLGSRDLGCYGGPVKTPALDQLAASGVRFTTFYSGAPVCSPARAVLLTGRQHLRTGVYTVIQDHLHDMHLLRREVTIAEHLRTNGYQTAHFGKWHLGTPFRGRAKPWIDEHGFDDWFATDLNAAPSHRDPVNFWRNRRRVGRIEGYACQIVVDEAISWLDKRTDSDRPFFMNVWFHEPHAPIAAPDQIVSKYGDLDDPAAIYSATIENTDRAIGRLIEKLKSTGELDNTVIFYTSDHGSYRPERNGALKGNKGSLYEGGIRTPGIFFWPEGIKPGQIQNTPGGAVDLLPTLCGLVGIAPPEGRQLDGTDLSPLLTGRGTFRRKVPLFWVSPTSQPIVVARDGRFSLVADRADEYPRDQRKISEVTAGMTAILKEELQPEDEFSREERWRLLWNYECSRDDWKKLRGQFVTLNTFQESWCPLIKDGSGGLVRFRLFDLSRDANQTEDISYRDPVRFARMKKQAIAFHEELIGEAVDWSDPDSVADHEGAADSIAERTRVHRLKSTQRSAYDAFTYVNRIPEERFSDETAEDLSARIFSRLANQEGRILLKAPSGMSPQAYTGYKIFMRYEGSTKVGNCAACHTPRFFADEKSHVVAKGGSATSTPSLRNMRMPREELKELLLGKVALAKQKRSGLADDVSDHYAAMQLSDEDIDALVGFLTLLSDVPDAQFRKLILEARVIETH